MLILLAVIFICTTDLHGARIWQGGVGWEVGWGGEGGNKGIQFRKNCLYNWTDLPKSVHMDSAGAGRQGALGDGVRDVILGVGSPWGKDAEGNLGEEGRQQSGRGSAEIKRIRLSGGMMSWWKETSRASSGAALRNALKVSQRGKLKKEEKRQASQGRVSVFYVMYSLNPRKVSYSLVSGTPWVFLPNKGMVNSARRGRKKKERRNNGLRARCYMESRIQLLFVEKFALYKCVIYSVLYSLFRCAIEVRSLSSPPPLIFTEHWVQALALILNLVLVIRASGACHRSVRLKICSALLEPACTCSQELATWWQVVAWDWLW